MLSALLRACYAHFREPDRKVFNEFLGRARPGYDKNLYIEFQSSFFSIEIINDLKMFFFQYGKHIDKFSPGHSST